MNGLKLRDTLDMTLGVGGLQHPLLAKGLKMKSRIL